MLKVHCMWCKFVRDGKEVRDTEIERNVRSNEEDMERYMEMRKGELCGDGKREK